MAKWPICGPKLSFCCTVISVWGIVQLSLMGIFYFVEAAPLLDGLEFNATIPDDKLFKKELNDAYSQCAYNCWIAAFLYVGLLVFSGSQFMINQKQLSGANNSPYTAPPFTGITTEENGFNRQYGIQFNEGQND
jgi:ribonuclease kappa